MKNTIKVTIPFSYKGIEHSPSSIIDLDLLAQGEQSIDAVTHHVAKDNHIDNYSYEYEVLESSPKVFSDPTGIAEKFLSHNTFDLEGFKQAVTLEHEQSILQKIAKETLGIKNLKEHDALQQALLQAYHAGKSQPG